MGAERAPAGVAAVYLNAAAGMVCDLQTPVGSGGLFIAEWFGRWLGLVGADSWSS